MWCMNEAVDQVCKGQLVIEGNSLRYRLNVGVAIRSSSMYTLNQWDECTSAGSILHANINLSFWILYI
jgi:hypothetical protein